MSVRVEKIWTPAIRAECDAIVSRYETRRAALLEVLRVLMEHFGHISLEIEEAVAAYLEIAPVHVREVVTFYTLFYTKPKAKTRIQVCRNLSCELCGGGQWIRYLEEKLGIRAGEMTPDGLFSLHTVECLGACEIAPAMQLNDDEYIGPLTKKKIDEIIEKGRKS
ncbi:MAG: NADH-quinone oxidoreductase subunit NuoE [Candidatus Omnitrophota bacterium]